MDTLSPRARLSSAAGLDWVRSRIAADPGVSRYRLAQEVCREFDWRDDVGRLREMACRKHLLALERRGVLVLPAARRAPPAARRDAGETVSWTEFSGTLAALGPVELRPVSGRSPGSGVWHALMEAHHPLGSGPLCGAQMRYLAVSRTQAVLGGLAVSAAAWRLAARDEWVGWSDADRGRHLGGVVCNSRFLILPTVRVKHLGSHVLGLLSRRLVADWQERYGISPFLMESYVEAWRSGTVYRAANWIEVGRTAGRGRQDREGRGGIPEKRIFLYPLRPLMLRGWQGRPASAPMGWVHREFGGAKLGDHRLERRLLDLAAAFFAKPLANIPQACGCEPATKAAYRFFDHRRTTMETLLAPHRLATIDRLRREPVVLVVQDTSSLNYTTHREMAGIGPIGTKVDGPQGLILHTAQSFRPDGTPLGILHVQCWSRDKESFGKKHRRHNLPIEQKESAKWLKPLAVIRQAADSGAKGRLVTVADRESDIYEFFVAAREKGLDLLVRAKDNRALADTEHRLWPHMERVAEALAFKLDVPARHRRKARIARMSLRFAEITLAPPATKPNLPPLRLWAVRAEEVEAPAEIEPLDWMLLTTVPVTSAEDAQERVRWYACRWGIEVFHRILKSGCRIEDRQLEQADRLEACLAIDLVVAWRIHYLTMMGRSTQDVPCTIVFEEDQWKALQVFTTKSQPPPTPPTLTAMIRLIGRLGGFLGRKSDRHPGTETIWRGLQRLDDITRSYQATRALYETTQR